jgi:hypothetical protein
LGRISSNIFPRLLLKGRMKEGFISPLWKIKEAREGWEATNLRFSFAPSLRKGRLGRVFHLPPVSLPLIKRGKIKETMGRGSFKNFPLY